MMLESGPNRLVTPLDVITKAKHHREHTAVLRARATCRVRYC